MVGCCGTAKSGYSGGDGKLGLDQFIAGYHYGVLRRKMESLALQLHER